MKDNTLGIGGAITLEKGKWAEKTYTGTFTDYEALEKWSGVK